MTRGKKIVRWLVAAAIALPLFAIAGLALFFRLLNPVLLGGTDAINGRLVSSGVQREYLVHVPATYDARKPAPLVISLHAAAMWPGTQQEISGWNAVADENGFIVVYPSAMRIAPAPFLPSLPAWSVRDEKARAREIRFISELIDALERRYNIDRERVYVNGFSNGGAMAFVLSCALAPRIAAVGIVGGAEELPSAWCANAGPMPLILFHGTDDPLVPYEGGTSTLSPRPFPAVRAWVDDWARRNRCAPGARDVPMRGVIRTDYASCAADTVLDTVSGGGHTWPGGKPMPKVLVGTTSTAIDATREMRRFFSEHRRELRGRRIFR